MHDSDTEIRLYRVRHIPKEKVLLSGDEILHLDEATLITRWNTLKPRKDFASGISLFNFKKHWKITRVAKADGSLFHWYCDIMKMHIGEDTQTGIVSYTMEDLLIDITLEPDGTVNILDLDEAAEAFEKGLITGKDLALALRAADELLKTIKSGEFAAYQDIIVNYVEGL